MIWRDSVVWLAVQCCYSMQHCLAHRRAQFICKWGQATHKEEWVWSLIGKKNPHYHSFIIFLFILNQIYWFLNFGFFWFFFKNIIRASINDHWRVVSSQSCVVVQRFQVNYFSPFLFSWKELIIVLLEWNIIYSCIIRFAWITIGRIRLFARWSKYQFFVFLKKIKKNKTIQKKLHAKIFFSGVLQEFRLKSMEFVWLTMQMLGK